MKNINVIAIAALLLFSIIGTVPTVANAGPLATGAYTTLSFPDCASAFESGGSVTLTTTVDVSLIARQGDGSIIGTSGPYPIPPKTYLSSGLLIVTPTVNPVSVDYVVNGSVLFTLTADSPCAPPASVNRIATDNRLDNNGDQGAQSVAIYCNSDGSLNLIPLQLSNPGPGSTSIKDTKGNNIIVKTAPLSTIAVNTTAKYDYGISVAAWSDGSWTVYRAELTGTGKTFAAQVFPSQCPQIKR